MSIIDPVRTRVDLATLDLTFGTFPNVQPFSPRTAIGYQDLLESLYRYVTRDIYTYLMTASGQATWDSNVDQLLAAIDGVLAQQKSDIDTETQAALEQLINSTIAVTDPVILGILNTTTSATRTLLDTLYKFTDPGLATVLSATTSTTRDYLDGRYPRKVSSGQNAITGWFHVDDFGAVGDGTTVDRSAIQAAITAANTKYSSTGVRQRVYLPPRVHVVDAVDYHKEDGTTYGAVSLMMLDGVTFSGPGTIKAKSGVVGPGALYAIIRSKSSGLSNAAIREITVDGNVSAQTASTQCSNIMLNALSEVEVSETSQVTPNGQGIQVIGTTTTYAKSIRINRNRVFNATSIGIQCSQFDGLEILNNTVGFCADNAIDIYGDDGSSTVAHGKNFRIQGNYTASCLTGVFCETVASGIVENNHIVSCTQAGIHVNRIHGQPSRIRILGNQIEGSPRGAYFTGDMDRIVFQDNTVVGASIACVQLGGGGGNVSGIALLNNSLDTATQDTTPLVLVPNDCLQVTTIRHRGTVTANAVRSWDFVNQATTTGGSMNISAANAA